MRRFMGLMGLVGLMSLMGFLGCSKITPEQQASFAAQGYYRHLAAGECELFLEGVAGSDSLPKDYREQLIVGYRQFVAEQRKAHGGIAAVKASNTVTDTLSGSINVFLLLQYSDSIEEEIVVPMVEQKPGQWRMK